MRWYSEQGWNRKRKEEKKRSYHKPCINLSCVHIISHYIYLYHISYIIYHIIFSYLILRSSTVLLNQASKMLLRLLFFFERNVQFCPKKRGKKTDTWENYQYFSYSLVPPRPGLFRVLKKRKEDFFRDFWATRKSTVTYFSHTNFDTASNW